MAATGGDPIEPGAGAPAFELEDQNGTARRLADAGGAPLVLFFYPKDDTPGCTKQACGFQAAEAMLAEAGATVWGVSPQGVKSKRRFADKHGLAFPLLADDDAAVCAAYGVWQEKSMYGKKYAGVVRTTYLIDATGKVARRWDKVKVGGHVDEVLAALRG
ncbi:putative peroxiredoxin [Phycisphaera mikurensis NBRC 102666]|uniref:thioredoxin-dependent peroxiredoxin n=2 Tax=Phycisphaera TaxID=666508 RepID=I0IGT5_PHYMF|nr:putative peroxiredoxin [Phycisphaera mikurensis NBRC 102666]